MADSPRIRSLTANGDMPRVVLADAGPFIGLFNREDRHHDEALRGFRELAEQRTRVIVPLPIVLEVYKWLRYHVGSDAALSALNRMLRTTQIDYPGPDEFERAVQLVRVRPSWGGSLQDAFLAQQALTTRLPLWTLNYRDFASFSAVRFWNPR